MTCMGTSPRRCSVNPWESRSHPVLEAFADPDLTSVESRRPHGPQDVVPAGNPPLFIRLQMGALETRLASTSSSRRCGARPAAMQAFGDMMVTLTLGGVRCQ